MKPIFAVLSTILVLASATPAMSQAIPLSPQDAKLPKIQMPDEFALVFTSGYVNDSMPKDPKVFEYMLENMKRVGINTVHCTYIDWRHELCKKHGVKMMIDLAAKEHDLKTGKYDDAVKTICKEVKGSKGVWGYAHWYDNGTSGAILNPGIIKLRQWDPTHPTFVGSYRHRGLESVTINPGCYGWYDFHWTRSHQWHSLNMHALHDICGRRGAIAGRFMAFSGLNQDLFTLHQSIASGVKMSLWFINGPLDREGLWHEEHDLVKIAVEVRHMYKELMLIGHPTHIFSTLTTKTHDNKPLPKPAIPRWFKPFPKDHWAQVTSGEAMFGFFKYKDGTDAIYVANHNAFAPQEMKIKLKRGAKVMMIDRKNGGWKELAVANKSVSFPLAAAAGELLKITK